MVHRHLHPSGYTKTIGGKEYRGIKEANDFFVANDGTFITRFNKDGSFRGTISCGRGKYFNLQIRKNHYQAHRVVFETWHNIEIPDGSELDHIDGNSQNNHLSNLRLVHSRKENMNNPVTKDKQHVWLEKLHANLEIESRRKSHQCAAVTTPSFKEHLRKLGQAQSVPVVLINPDGSKEEFSSIADAARKHNLAACSISMCLRGKLKTTGGFKFVRAN